MTTDNRFVQVPEYICQHDEFCGRISNPHSTACMDANVRRLDEERCVFIDINELQRQAELDKIGTGENDHGMAAALHATALNVLAAMTPEQRALQAKRAEERRVRNERIDDSGVITPVWDGEGVTWKYEGEA